MSSSVPSTRPAATAARRRRPGNLSIVGLLTAAVLSAALPASGTAPKDLGEVWAEQPPIPVDVLTTPVGSTSAFSVPD